MYYLEVKTLLTPPCNRQRIQTTTAPIQEFDQDLPQSAQNVFLFFDTPAGTHILPYLSLADIEAVTRSHPKLKVIIESYFRAGHKLMIDEKSLWQYSVENNKDLYSKYGVLATNIEFHGLFGYELESLFPLFPNIAQLTLRKVQLCEKVKPSKYPRSLHTLNIVDSKMGWNWGAWVGEIASLQVLRLEGLGLSSLSNVQQVRSLTLINQSVYMPEYCLPMLEDLTIDKCWKSISYKDLRSLCSLGRLKYLRVLGCVDWKQMEQIEALQLETVDILHYVEPPEESNLILRLNDDCMLHLQKFLYYCDWINLRNLHPKWQHLNISYFRIDREYLLGGPDRLQCYRLIGPMVTWLSVYEVPAKEFSTAIPYFKNLRKLEMHVDEEMAKVIDTKHIRGLRSLALTFDREGINWRRLFRRLSPTLTELELGNHGVSNERCIGLSELRNIQHFTVDGINFQKDFLKFLNINQNTLISINMNEFWLTDDTSPYYAISQMPNLKALKLGSVRVPVPRGSLPALTDLSLELPNEAGLAFLLSLDGSRLRSLTINCSYSAYKPELGEDLWTKVRNLEVLRIERYDMSSLLPAIFILKKLTHLDLMDHVLVEDLQVPQLVESLPQLRVLQLTEYKPSILTICQVREYLRKHNRKLQLNQLQL